MSGAMRKMGIYLGLVEEDDRALDDRAMDDPEYAERVRDEERQAYAEERTTREPRAVEAPRGYSSYETPVGSGSSRRPTGADEPAVRRPRPDRAPRVWTPEPVAHVATTPRTTVERPGAAEPANYRITTLHPKTYNEARTIGEQFRGGVPVIMNLTEMDDADAKRLVDFAAGLSFGLRGSIERVTNKVFLLSPQNVSVTAEDKARIAGGGFFNQS